MILHVDMDAFYASVEERENPRLRGRPLIVGGSATGRGVVAAANYAVRKFGVHSAMSTRRALELCPQAIVIPPRLDFYAAISKQLREIFFRYTPLVEPLSLDEAFLDASGSTLLFGSAEVIARSIKTDIQMETGLVASVGVAPNKFLAKIASDLQKPDGLVVVPSEDVQPFLDPLPVSKLWGVGKVAGEVLARLGVRSVYDLRHLDASTLRRHFGQHGEHLFQLAHGVDDRRVVPDREAKSISHETTFEQDVHDAEMLRASLLELTEQVGYRLRHNHRRGRTVQIKLRHADFRTITRARTLPQATSVTNALWEVAGELLKEAIPVVHQGFRLLGIGVSNLSENQPAQKLLFAPEDDRTQEELDSVADAIREKFGTTALGRGSRLLRNAPQDRNPKHRG